MVLLGIWTKFKRLIIIIVIVLVIIGMIKVFGWGKSIKEVMSQEASLMNAVSKFSADSSDRSVASFLATTAVPVSFDYLDAESPVMADDDLAAKPGRPPVRRKGSKTSTYKREELCRKYLEDRYDDYFPTCRPKFLANPATGRPLELDGYNAALNIAFEHQGKQHYEFTARFHKSIADFQDQVLRDQFKKLRLAELGIDLLVIPYSVPEHLIGAYIEELLASLDRK